MSAGPSHRRAVRPLVAMLLLLGGAVHADAGENLGFVEPYNELVRMIWARCDAAGLGRSKLALKDPASSAEELVAGSDVNALQDATRELLSRFVKPEPTRPGPWTIDEALEAKAWQTLAVGASAFVWIPAAYTRNHEPVLSNSDHPVDMPVLWEQFEDLHQRLLAMRYTLARGGHWSAEGEPNRRVFQTGQEFDWGTTMAQARSGYPMAACTTVANMAPCFYTGGGRWNSSLGVILGAEVNAVNGCFVFTDLPAATGKVTVYAYARAYCTMVSANRYVRDWDGYGVVGLNQNAWAAQGIATIETGGRAVSRRIGPAVLSQAEAPGAWCQAPPDPSPGDRSSSTRGFGVDAMVGVVEWTGLYSPTLLRPRCNSDSGQDGVVHVSCDCVSECKPSADPAWQSMLSRPNCRFPLGISSGLQTGGLRVQAYLSEWEEGGQRRQLLSLESYARVKSDPKGNWCFVTIRRPNGAEARFCVDASGQGNPIDGGGGYRMRYRNDVAELHFGGQDQVVHVFGDRSSTPNVWGVKELSEVRATRQHQEIRVGRRRVGTSVLWPSLEIARAESGRGRITSVGSPVAPMAELRYGADGLAEDVIMHDQNQAEVAEMSVGTAPAPSALARTGSSTPRLLADAAVIESVRTFITRDGHGEVQNQVRVATRTDGADFWRYGAASEAAQLESLRVVRDEATGVERVRRAVVLNPGAADAHSNITETVVETFPWGRDVTREIVGADDANPRVTTTTYYDDPADSNNYTRPRLIEEPDGGWSRYAYDAAGREILRVEPLGDAGPDADVGACRATRTAYAGDPALAALNVPSGDVSVFNDRRPRLTVETVAGHEVARTYWVYLPDVVVVQRCREPGAAYGAAGNLVTTRRVLTSGLFAGWESEETEPDGTFSRSAYAYDAARDQLTTTRERGAGLGGVVTNGTRTVTVTDAANRRVSSTSRDIASGLVLEDEVYQRDAFGRVTNRIDRVEGTSVREEYGCCGVERSVDADGVETRQDFTALKQVMVATRAGVASHRAYDSWGNVVREWTSGGGVDGGREWRGYDGAGRLVGSTNALGAGTAYRYERTPEGGRRVTITDAAGGTRVETYRRDGRLHAVGGTAVAPVCYAYGAEDGETWVTEYRGADTNAGEWVRTVSDMLGQEKRVEHPDGYAVVTDRDGAGRQVRRRDGYTMELTAYGPRGDVLRQATDMDGDGEIGLAGVDRVTETDTRITEVGGVAVSETESRVYTDVGSGVATAQAVTRRSLDGLQTWSVAHGRTNHTRRVRDAASGTRVETQTREDGTQTVLTFTNGLLVCEEERAADGARVAVRRRGYDGLQRLESTEDVAAGGEVRETRYAYDAAGQATCVVERAGALVRETRSEFDALGRRVRTVLPDGGVVEYGYSPRGELAWQRGARTYPVRYAFDEQGRMAAMSTFRQGFDGPADVTRWEYDARRGWLARKIYADGTEVVHTAQANGLPRGRRWARGVEARYAYDPGGLVTNTSYTDGTPELRQRRDRQGRLVEVRDGIGVHSLDYNADGTLRAETLPQAEGAVLVGAYDALGRLTNTTLRLEGVEAVRAGYAFDRAGRLAVVSDGAREAVYGYGADGRTVTNVDLGDGVRVAKSIDGFGRLLETRTWAGTTEVHRSAYAYNAADQRTRQDWGDGSSWRYTYDELGQVVSGKRFFADGVPVGGNQFEYAYDTIGNRTSARNFHGITTQTQGYQANALNQVTQRTVPGEIWVTGETASNAAVVVRRGWDAAARSANRHGGFFWVAMGVSNAEAAVVETNLAVVTRLAVEEGGVTQGWYRTEERAAVVEATPERYEYDADGNLTRDGLWTYTWDGENRLVAVESAEPALPESMRRRVEFIYDYLGRRVSTRVMGRVNGAWVEQEARTFFWNNWLMAAERIAGAGEVVTNTYWWGLDLSQSLEGAGGIGGLLGVTFGGSNTVTTAYDGSGNVMALFDASGAIAARYEYGPFGEPLRATGAGAESNPWRFSTRYADPETGLSIYPKRAYSHAKGRWLSRDTMEESGGPGLYGFLGDDCVNFVDPWGLALYAFDGTWNDRDKMKRPTNVAKLAAVYDGLVAYRKGVGTDWYTRLLGGMTGAGGGNRIEDMYADLVRIYNTPDPMGENQQIDVIGFSRGAALARTFINYINSKGGVPLLTPNGQPSGVFCPVTIRFLGIFDTVASFGVPGNDVDWGQDLSIPQNVENVRHAVALDEKRQMFPLSSVLSDPNNPNADPRIVERGFRGAHSDIGGGYEDGDRSDFALKWMHDEGVAVGVPFGPLASDDMKVTNPIIHDERGPRARRWDWPRKVYYPNAGR